MDGNFGPNGCSRSLLSASGAGLGKRQGISHGLGPVHLRATRRRRTKETARRKEGRCQEKTTKGGESEKGSSKRQCQSRSRQQQWKRYLQQQRGRRSRCLGSLTVRGCRHQRSACGRNFRLYRKGVRTGRLQIQTGDGR